MSVVAPSPSVATSNLAAATQPRGDDDLRKVAEGFEAIFIRKILETARAADFGGEDVFGGQALETFTAMRDEYVADIVSGTGAFGFAASIERHLAARLPGPSSSTDEG